METVKKYCALPAFAFILILAAGAFFFFYRFYQRDLKTLADFTAAYEAYDRAISVYSTTVLAADPDCAAAPGEPERIAGEAQMTLVSKASARISSTIKNEKEAMRTMLEIADLSKEELGSLKAYQCAAAAKNANLDQRVKDYNELASKRQAAYAHFLSLGG